MSEKENKQRQKKLIRNRPKPPLLPLLLVLPVWMFQSESQRRTESERKKSKSKVDEWDDEDGDQWPCIVRGVQQKQGEVEKRAKIAGNGRTRTAPLVAITTPATIAIPCRGVDGPQNNAIIINQIMLYVKDLITVHNFLEDLIV